MSNALGLIIASWVLDDVTISGSAFFVAVVIFTVVYAIAQPFFTQMAHERHLRCAVASHWWRPWSA